MRWTWSGCSMLAFSAIPIPSLVMQGVTSPTKGDTSAACFRAWYSLSVRDEGRTMIQGGKKAPDFVAPAYVKGQFISVKLSDYLGQWVVLCFYPGDFTFV